MARAPREPAKLARGTAADPRTVSGTPSVITSIAPSDAPADTPSVKGVASGLRSKACNTTPAAANAAPTSAPAMARGSRAIKKIWASTFSANGMVPSNTRLRLMLVGPMSGATTQVTTASRPNPICTAQTRRRRLPAVAGRRAARVVVVSGISVRGATAAPVAPPSGVR